MSFHLFLSIKVRYSLKASNPIGAPKIGIEYTKAPECFKMKHLYINSIPITAKTKNNALLCNNLLLIHNKDRKNINPK